MNRQKCKVLRKYSYDLAADHLKTLLPEQEVGLVTGDSVREFEKNQERYVFNGRYLTLAPKSSDWFYRRLKNIARKKNLPVDSKLKALRELGLDV